MFILNKDAELRYVLERYQEKTGHAAEYIQARQETLDELETNLRKEVGAVPGGHVLLGGNATKDME